MRRTRTTLLARTIVVAALASAATVLALPGGGGAAAQDKPANTTEPRITGTASVGSTLSATTGSWTGNPTGFAFNVPLQASPGDLVYAAVYVAACFALAVVLFQRRDIA